MRGGAWDRARGSGTLQGGDPHGIPLSEWRRLATAGELEPCTNPDLTTNQVEVAIGVRCSEHVQGFGFGLGLDNSPLPPGYLSGVVATRRPDFRDFPVEASCQAHRDAGRTVSGRYRVSLPNRSPIDVHCDMELDGGGWMLVGRSNLNGVAIGFGWNNDTGDLDDFNEGYSIGGELFASGADDFNAMLLTDADGGVTPQNVVLRLEGSGTTLNTTGSVWLTNVTSLRGPWSTGGIVLASSTNADHFAFFDQIGLPSASLQPDRLDINGCRGFGDVVDVQGLLFVR